MNAQSRRNAIMEVLKAEEKPVSASTLAKQFNVSRQIIVGDIALLRAGGADISATPKGYVLAREREGLVRSIVCKHSGLEEMAQGGVTVMILSNNRNPVRVERFCRELGIEYEGHASSWSPSPRTKPTSSPSSPTASTCTPSAARTKPPSSGYRRSWIGRDFW